MFFLKKRDKKLDDNMKYKLFKNIFEVFISIKFLLYNFQVKLFFEKKS